jgi:importin subunit beta-1
LAEGISREIPLDATSSPLSPYFDALITSLLACVDNKPNQDANTKATVYEAIATLVSTCSTDCFPTIEKLATLMLAKLNDTISMQVCGCFYLFLFYFSKANICV